MTATLVNFIILSKNTERKKGHPWSRGGGGGEVGKG